MTTWAMLIPAEPDWIAERVHALVEEDEGAPPDQEPTIQRGTSGYSAVLASRPEEELPEWIAEALSRELPAPIYILDMPPGDAPAVMAYVHGQLEGEARTPEEICRSTGCPLPLPQPPAAPASDWRTVGVVEGLSPEETRAVLATARAVPAWMHFDAVPKGTLMWSEHGDVLSAELDVWEARPDLTIYAVASSPGQKRLEVKKYHGDESEALADPERIVAALGVPPRLLGR